MSKRALAGWIILAAWAAGTAMMIRREVFRPPFERLAEAALRVTPAAVFYMVMQGDKQVGFASSTVDTATTMIEQRDYLVADVVTNGQVRRVEARTNIQLTRTLRVRNFDASVESGETPVRVQGIVSADTQVAIVRDAIAGQDADTQRVSVDGPILLPTLLPLAIALESQPSVGRTHVLPMLDLATMTPRDVRVEVMAESVFVVNDSSVFDSTSGRWKGVLPDTVRGWKLKPETGVDLDGWVDAQGRLVASNQLGFTLRRAPYEVAFENWRRDTDAMPRNPATVAAANANTSKNIVTATLIASNKRVNVATRELRATLTGFSRHGLDLAGGRQRFRSDTLFVTREDGPMLAARYFPILGNQKGDNVTLKAQPFLEVDHREIVALSERLINRSREPRFIVQQLNRWVFDSLKKAPTAGIPSALHVLHTKSGDANEHTQLFVALARAAGIPTRIVVGLLYVDGKFYYHSWAEVMMRDWVAVDPTLGQFPADASHLRFLIGGLDRQTDLMRLAANLKIDVIGTR